MLKFSKVISITHFSFAGRVNTDERGRRASAFEMTPWVFWVLRKAASILKNKNCTQKIFFKGKKKMLTRSEITSRRTSLPISRSSSSLRARCEWERTESDPPPQKNTFVMPNKKKQISAKVQCLNNASFLRCKRIFSPLKNSFALCAFTLFKLQANSSL